jgi:hypothetical protein
LGARLVIPEAGILGDIVQFGKSVARLIEVKDASSAVPWTA